MNPTQRPAQAGTVYLVGSGPGALDLMTVRATRLIGEADVVVHDHLIADGALSLLRNDAQAICVGKKASNHTVPQNELNLLLVRLAREGKKVVRLKGGDPFIFGRGGEEIETLFEFGIPFEVVPGVTAAAGCAAYAGIPLTHREHAQTVTFATGHLKDGSVDLDWSALARPKQTVVFYMGIGGIGEICRQLIVHGLPATHPAAVVQNGSSERQRVLIADLATLPEQIEKAGLTSPALIIVGTVVSLHRKLAWYQPSNWPRV
ncbi:uroporphyrinogen-III C-methyltransferase [Propionivibrio sp.]|uniref:uroporphyrinogen-III C-methyltransferase n=1 Tax=Propionivibrio sp. TaxID=2212460 RepID=UPI002626DF80|nr:uroporphyrinogen-III C-methyltransferase [Propionivibrio sp.]